MKKKYILQTFGDGKAWYWRLRARQGGRIKCDGAESYTQKHDVQRAVRSMPFDWSQVEVVHLETAPPK